MARVDKHSTPLIMRARLASPRGAFLGVSALVVLLLLSPFGAERVAAQSGSRLGAPGAPPGPAVEKRSTLPGEIKYTPPDAENVVDVRVEGNQTVTSTAIFSQVKTRAGRAFDPYVVQKDVRRLASKGWFLDVEPRYQQAPGGRIVIFKVTERPKLRYVRYLGNSSIKNKTLAKKTSLKVDQALDPYAIDEGRRRIEEFYREKGFNDVVVTVWEGDKPTDLGAVFVIDEGTKQKIWSVDFIGNTIVSDSRLKTQIQSKPGWFKYFKGEVNRQRIDEDVDRLTDYYRGLGYLQAKIGRIPEFDEKGWLNLTFVIDEGPRFTVRSISFIGNDKFDSETLASLMELKEGDFFNRDKLNEDTGTLRDLYGSQGYVFADVRPDPRYLEEPSQLDLIFDISEGKLYRVGEIHVRIGGDNPHTKIQTALNRISLASGDIIDITKIRKDEIRLRRPGIFESNPAQGNPPKIVLKAPEADDVRLARPSSAGDGFRGQSPDNGVAPWRSNRPPVPSGHVVPSGHNQISPQGAPQRVASAVFPSPDASSRGSIEARDSDPLPPPVPLGDRSKLIIRYQSPSGGQPPRFVGQQPPVASGRATTETIQPSQPRGSQPISKTLMSWTSPARLQKNSARPAATPQRGNNFSYRAQSPSATSPFGTTRGATQYGGQTVGAVGPNDTYAQPTNSVYRQTAAPAARNPGAPAYTNGPSYTTTNGATYPPGTYSPGAQAYQVNQPPANSALGNSTMGNPSAGNSLFRSPTYQNPNGAAAGVPAISSSMVTDPSGQFPGGYDPYNGGIPDPTSDLEIFLEETQTGRFMAGVGVNSDAGLVGNISITEKNFDIWRIPTTFQDIRNGTAWRGAGQIFRIEALPGTEVQRYMVNFTEPYLFQTQTSFGIGGFLYDRRFRDWDEQRLGGRLSLGRQLSPDLSVAGTFRGERVRLSNPQVPTPPEVAMAVGNNELFGFKGTLIHDTRDSQFLATTGHYIELGGEQVVGTYSYPRAEFNFRQYFLMRERPDRSGRHVLSMTARLGFTGDNTPVYDNFFAGGYSTLRGWDFRGASPTVGGVVVGGEFMWINSIEYLMPLTADDMLRGVAFVDFGTVERDVEINDFRVAPGFGLRVTVPALGPAPIALDFAFPVLKADTDDTQVFSFNIGLQR